MFTGIIEELGQVVEIEVVNELLEVSIQAHAILKNCFIGASISVNGCCLSVTSFTSEKFTVQIILESQNKTWLNQLSKGQFVNLERPLKVESRLDGHIVQGHVDTVGKVTSRKVMEDGSVMLTVSPPAGFHKYLVKKGSIALDGVSLTIADLLPSEFSVAIIPHTLTHTNMAYKKVNDPMNIEVDVIAKHVERLMENTFYETK